jgi:hypothetical protein
MLIDNMLAYAEVDEILNLLEDEYSNKVPENVRNFFKEERMEDYEPQIDIEKPLTEQNLKRETIVLLTILNLNYWCEASEKQVLLDELTSNEEEKNKLAEKYNPDNLFKNDDNDIAKKTENVVENTSIIKYEKQSLFKKIYEKIYN